AGDGGPQELRPLRGRGRQGGAGLGQRTAQRAVAGPPRRAERIAAPRPRPAAARGTEVRRLPRRPQRGVPGHVQAALPGGLRLPRRRRLAGAAAVPYLCRWPPRGGTVRGDPAEPPRARLGCGFGLAGRFERLFSLAGAHSRFWPPFREVATRTKPRNPRTYN